MGLNDEFTTDQQPNTSPNFPPQQQQHLAPAAVGITTGGGDDLPYTIPNNHGQNMYPSPQQIQPNNNLMHHPPPYQPQPLTQSALTQQMQQMQQQQQQQQQQPPMNYPPLVNNQNVAAQQLPQSSPPPSYALNHFPPSNPNTMPSPPPPGASAVQPPPYQPQATHAYYLNSPTPIIQSPYNNVNIVYQTVQQQQQFPYGVNNSVAHLNVPIDVEYYPNYTPDLIINSTQSYGLGSVQDSIHEFSIIKEKSSGLTNIYVKPNSFIQVNDELLQSIGECRGLEYLNLSGCTSFSTNAFCKVISRLGRLKAINLSNCSHLNDDAVRTMARNCPQLEEIHLNCLFQISDDSIITIADRCKKLKVLSISQCEKLSDRSIKYLASKLTTLESLCINKLKYITDESMSDLRKFNLRSLFAFETLITDVTISELALKSRNLEILNVSKCINITDNSISILALHCPNLQKLFLQDCKSITSLSIGLISQKCINLRVLRIDGCTNITDDAIYPLEQLRNLQILNLSHLSKINEQSICKILPSLSQLEQVYLYNCPRISDLCVGQIARSCPNLRILRIDQSIYPSDESVGMVVSSCRNLKLLNVAFLDHIHDNTLISLAQQQKFLQKLYLTGCKNIGNDGLMALSNIQTLEVLRLDDSFQFSADALSSISRLANLSILNISGCINTNDIVLNLITCYCRQLTQLYLSKLPQITDKPLPTLLSSLTRLRVLRMDGCPNVTQGSLVNLKFAARLYLEIFNCSETCIGNEGIFTIVSQAPIKELYCWGCDITDDGLKKLVGLVPSLQTLRVDKCSKITDKGMRPFVQRTPLLRILNISDTNVGDETLISIAGYCKSLKKLFAKSCSKVSDKGVNAVAFQCSELKAINISSTKVTDTAIIELATKSKLLRKIYIGHLSKISNASLIKLSVGCPLLKLVDVQSSQNIGEVAILSLSTYCKRLITLNVNNCPLVTDLSLVGIGRECLQLKNLYASGTAVASRGVVEVAVRSNINLETLELKSTDIDNSVLVMISQMCPSLRSLDIRQTKHLHTSAEGIEQIRKQCRLLKNFLIN
eukprot:gene8579-10557_t